MTSDTLIQKSLTLHPRHWAALSQIAADRKFRSSAAAARYVVDRYTQANRLETVARAYASDLITSREAADELVKAVLESKAE